MIKSLNVYYHCGVCGDECFIKDFPRSSEDGRFHIPSLGCGNPDHDKDDFVAYNIAIEVVEEDNGGTDIGSQS